MPPSVDIWFLVVSNSGWHGAMLCYLDVFSCQFAKEVVRNLWSCACCTPLDSPSIATAFPLRAGKEKCSHLLGTGIAWVCHKGEKTQLGVARFACSYNAQYEFNHGHRGING